MEVIIGGPSSEFCANTRYFKKLPTHSKSHLGPNKNIFWHQNNKRNILGTGTERKNYFFNFCIALLCCDTIIIVKSSHSS